MGDHKFKGNERVQFNGKTVGGDIRGDEHFDALHNRPERDPMTKRPLIDSSSHSAGGPRQKTVESSVAGAKQVIVAQQADGWLYHSVLHFGGGECLLIFQR